MKLADDLVRQYTKPVGWVGDRTCGFNMNKKLFYSEEERNAPILPPKYSLLRLW